MARINRQYGVMALVTLFALSGCGGSDNSAPANVAVPNVVGLTQAAATTAITGAGLKLGTVATASSSTVVSGSVISESPGASTSVASGSTVNLTVSSGPAPVTVPNVVGMTQAAATTAITGAGLNLGTVTMASSATVASGSVISQTPA
ncbi:MAG TPA: PASTA domain-containing protein, partial [Steroidobacteraceae bacterium]